LKMNVQELAFLENVRRQLGFTSLNDFIKFCIKIAIDIVSYPNVDEIRSQVGVNSLSDFIRYCIKTVELELKNKENREKVKEVDSKRGAKS